MVCILREPSADRMIAATVGPVYRFSRFCLKLVALVLTAGMAIASERAIGDGRRVIL